MLKPVCHVTDRLPFLPQRVIIWGDGAHKSHE